MSYEKIIYPLLAMGLVVAVIYVLIPRLKGNAPVILRTTLFFGAIVFLAIDFYMKGKYLFLVPLALGSIAFIVYLKSYNRK